MWIIKELIINIIHMFFVVSAIKIIEKNKFKLNSHTVSVIWISIVLMLVINLAFYSNIEAKAILSLIIFAFLYSKLYNKKLLEGVSISFVVIFLLFISEIFCSLLFVLLKIDLSSRINEFKIMVIVNLIIGTLLIFIVNNRRLGNGIRKIVNLLKKKVIIHLFLIIVLVMGILTKRNIYSNNNTDYILNLILIMVFVYLIHLLYKDKLNIKLLSEEHEILYNYIIKYENELNEKNKIIHEFKNQLITINGFLDTNLQKTKSYLKEIINDVKDKDSIFLKELNKIPKGGLKGLFYYKLLNVNNNLKLNFIIDKKINLLDDINISLYKNVIKILGVYLDNAIEASILSEEKIIEIEIYEENKELNFIISNTFSEKVNTSQIGNYRYSNKGKNRGYGLLLVKDILNNNKNIYSNYKIINNYYIVTLKLKI